MIAVSNRRNLLMSGAYKLNVVFTNCKKTRKSSEFKVWSDRPSSTFVTIFVLDQSDQHKRSMDVRTFGGKTKIKRENEIDDRFTSSFSPTSDSLPLMITFSFTSGNFWLAKNLIWLNQRRTLTNFSSGEPNVKTWKLVVNDLKGIKNVFGTKKDVFE